MISIADTVHETHTTVIETTPIIETQRTTVTTQSNTAQLPLAIGSRAIHFEDFDVNRDNMLTADEIGEVLFKLYDTDGNQVIDNVEYERPAVLTISPMETTTKVTYDFDGDGIADKQVYTYDTFMQHSLLSRFDKNSNGLSAHEFTGKSFLEADVDKSKAIESKEWEGTYVASIDDKNRAEAALNK